MAFFSSFFRLEADVKAATLEKKSNGVIDSVSLL